jgi:acyl-CoA reductase-like NAD-dependent aldehyde dehydrogenase
MSESLKVISPIDGSVYAERPIASGAAIDAALSAARAALPQWKATPIAERDGTGALGHA